MVDSNCDQQNKKCLHCYPGFYDENCSSVCSEDCDIKIGEKNRTCTKNGTCELCPKNKTGALCNDECEKGCDTSQGNCDQFNKSCPKCFEGYWGDKCNEICPENCLNGCDKTTGACFNCKTNHTGVNCTEECNIGCNTEHKNCEQYNEKYCEICRDGFYGHNCSLSCTNCSKVEGHTEPTCDKVSGRCDVCNFGLFGESCEKECDYCKPNTFCDRSSGNCTECPQDKFGIKCEGNCSDNCLVDGDNPICDFVSGNCLKCDPTHGGDNCTEECEKGCLIDDENKCHKENGFCDLCNNTVYGDYCNITCVGCLGGCNKNGYCQELECTDGYFGMKCEKECNCTQNEYAEKYNISKKCSKYTGYCLECPFGQYGNKCEKLCPYTCLNPSCCAFKQTDKNEKLKTIGINSSKGKYMTVKINGKSYTLEIDYTNGYQITLFNSTSNLTGCSGVNKNFTKGNEEPINFNVKQDFENYYAEGTAYRFNVTVNVNHENFTEITINSSVLIASFLKCKTNSEETIDGLIGLGYFNQFSDDIIQAGYADRSLTAYQIKQGEMIITIGNMNDTALKDFNKFAICDLLDPKSSDFFHKDLSCRTSGIKFSNDDNGYSFTQTDSEKLTNVTFTPLKNSSIILKNKFLDFIIDHYFNNDTKCTKEEQNGYIELHCPTSLNLNRLPNLGFIMSSHVFSYRPKQLFTQAPNNEYLLFLIKFYPSNTNDEEYNIINIGKEYLTESQYFAVNNEESKFFLYTNPVVYFGDSKLKGIDEDRTSFNLSPLFWSWMSVIIVLLLNIGFFVIYFLLKRRRMRSKDYIKV